MSTQVNRRGWPKKLLVEGNDDVHVVANIRDSCHIEDNFEIIDCKSVSEIKPTLTSLLKNPPKVIGIIVDADAETDNPNKALTARWQSLRDKLRREGYSVPDDPDPNGTIILGFGRKP